MSTRHNACRHHEGLSPTVGRATRDWDQPTPAGGPRSPDRPWEAAAYLLGNSGWSGLPKLINSPGTMSGFRSPGQRRLLLHAAPWAASGAYQQSQSRSGVSTCVVQRSSQHFKGFALDTVIGAITQGHPFRHLVGFSTAERSRAKRDTRYNTELRTGEYPLIDWGWGRADALRFLEETFNEKWIKSACTYCLLFALMSCLGRALHWR